MPTFTPNPSFVIQESYHVYLILHYIHITHHAFIPNQNRPFKNKQIFNHNTASPSTSLRLRDLAQARQSRQDESLSALARAQQEQEGNARSRLSEIPLAWASCVLAQNTPWSPERPLAQEALGEPLHISPGRVKLA